MKEPILPGAGRVDGPGEAPVLYLAGTYRRVVQASLARVWENVFDWEHLAHLHDGSFAACALLDRGAWGWQVALTPQGGKQQRIEMRADRATGRYTSTTIAGPGMGTEIRVALRPTSSAHVDVTVEFHLPESRPDRLASLGDAYVAVYARLWDEDEAMMQTREQASARRLVPTRGSAPLDLGDEPKVRATLPQRFDFGGASFRLVDVDGELVAHATVCPHWLGPLDDVPLVDGAVRCPWHGYVFDVVSGRCAAHPGIKLTPAPAIRIEAGRVIAMWPG